MVSLRSLSPEQPQFHLQKYISYKSISKIQGPQKCISLSLRLFNDSGTGCLFHSDVLVLLMGNVAIWREDEECELLCPNQPVVPRPRTCLRTAHQNTFSLHAESNLFLSLRMESPDSRTVFEAVQFPTHKLRVTSDQSKGKGCSFNSWFIFLRCF